MIENKKIKLRTRFLISVSVGIIALIITFSVLMSKPFGDTPGKIKEVEMAIENILRGVGEKQDMVVNGKPLVDEKTGETLRAILLAPSWKDIKNITDKLIYDNEKIAKAKVLVRCEEKPGYMPSYEDYLWDNRFSISKEIWKIQTVGARVLSSAGIAVLWCVGCIIAGLLALTIILKLTDFMPRGVFPGGE